MKNHLLKLPESIKKRTNKGFLSPSILIKEIDISSGQIVLEIGRPVGFFAPAILEVLSGTGKLIIGGPNTESFEKLYHLLNQYSNFEQILLSEIINSKLKNSSVDTVIFTNLFSNTSYIQHFCSSLPQFMKPGGELVVFDWDPEHPDVGSNPDSRYQKHQVAKLLENYGLSFSRELDIPGYHFGLVFRFG